MHCVTCPVLLWHVCMCVPAPMGPGLCLVCAARCAGQALGTRGALPSSPSPSRAELVPLPVGHKNIAAQPGDMRVLGRSLCVVRPHVGAHMCTLPYIRLLSGSEPDDLPRRPPCPLYPLPHSLPSKDLTGYPTLLLWLGPSPEIGQTIGNPVFLPPWAGTSLWVPTVT
jgi:hypothetical protein